MLKLAGYINILIAIGHIVGLFWIDKMFEVTGIAESMEGLENGDLWLQGMGYKTE